MLRSAGRSWAWGLFDLISTSMKVDTFLAQEKIFGETYQGVWSLMKEGVVASAEYIAANFASLSDIATGVSDVLTEGATDAFLNEFKQEMMKEAAKFLAEDMGLGAAADLIVKGRSQRRYGGWCGNTGSYLCLLCLSCLRYCQLVSQYHLGMHDG